MPLRAASAHLAVVHAGSTSRSACAPSLLTPVLTDAATWRGRFPSSSVPALARYAASIDMSKAHAPSAVFSQG